jgi:hypothetical protein
MICTGVVAHGLGWAQAQWGARYRYSALARGVLCACFWLLLLDWGALI